MMDNNIIKFLLEDAGHKVMICMTPDDAYREVMTHTQLVIMGEPLSQVSGCTIIKQIQTQGYNGPIIFVARPNSVNDKIEALNLGCEDYITKPYEASVLLATINAVLRRSMSIDHNESAVICVGDANLNTRTHT
ncbi:MAG TPA: response regulator, partial [Candidatus Woesebacteria bacterium]|nr:response regulator [Candidatus Woesebacteria bacterium]